jgi:hypothetical protein
MRTNHNDDRRYKHFLMYTPNEDYAGVYTGAVEKEQELPAV